jgi:hypothetical protein
MSRIASACHAKIASWVQSLASPSQTHASGMLILIGLLAAATTATTTDAQSVHEPVRAKDSSSPKSADGSTTAPGEIPAKEYNNQDLLYYMAMGMLVSQGIIRLITFVSSRREAAALAAAKKNDDLHVDKKGKGRRKGLSLNALEELDEETIKKRKEHLATLGEKAELLGSDTEDDDYEEDSEEESESEEEEEEESEEEEEEVVVEESESEGEIERRRRVLITGDAEIEE